MDQQFDSKIVEVFDWRIVDDQLEDEKFIPKIQVEFYSKIKCNSTGTKIHTSLGFTRKLTEFNPRSSNQELGSSVLETQETFNLQLVFALRKCLSQNFLGSQEVSSHCLGTTLSKRKITVWFIFWWPRRSK